MDAIKSPERTNQQRFDGACGVFTGRMQTVANWKHSYFGAAYSTRLRQAIKEARDACDTLEITMQQLGEWEPRMAKIVNVERKEWPAGALDRLKTVDANCALMTPEERHAAFNWLKSKYRAEWPSDL